MERERRPKRPGVAAGAARITRLGSQSGRGGHSMSARPQLAPAFQIDRGLLLSGGLLSTFAPPPLPNSMLHRASRSAAGNKPVRWSIRHLCSPSPPAKFATRFTRAARDSTVRGRYSREHKPPRPIRVGHLPNHMNFGGPKRPQRNSTGLPASNRQESVIEMTFSSQRASLVPADSAQVLAQFWKFQLRPSRKANGTKAILGADVISS